MSERVLPIVDDLDTGGFFEAAADGRLAIAHCAHCGAVLHVPRAYCRGCGNFGIEWRTVEPTGSVYSYIVVTHQVHEAFAVPHTIVLVELDDLPGVRLTGWLAGEPDIHIGQRACTQFEQVADDTTLPQWRLID